MGPYELLMIVGSIVIFGLIPPIAVGWFSYRQGKRGYNEAIKSRDDAMVLLEQVRKQLQFANNDLELIKSYLKELPDSRTLLDKIQKSVQGTYGRLIRSAHEEMEANLDGAAEQIADKIPQEQKMAMIGQRMQSAIMDKVMGFLS